MSEDLKSSICADIASSGLPELDYSSFKRQFFNPPSGVRAVLLKGTMNLCISGENESKVVVLKTINESFADNLDEPHKQKLFQYFEREAGIWRHITSHPNILELYGYVMIPEDPFPSLVAPYYPAGDLRAFVGRHHELSPRQRIMLACDISRGLEFLHNLTPVIVHRDIRAANALVQQAGGALSAVIIDFGSAKLLDPDLFNILKSTRINHRAWSPPEYVRNKEEYRNPTTYGDIWSLACTCLEIFTARDPFPDGYEAKEELLKGNHPPKQSDDISDALWKFMEECWNVTPHLRPSARKATYKLQFLAENA